jgi:uncharacterized protein
MSFDATSIALITAILILAGFTKGVLGFGLPSVGLGLLGLLMSPSQAAALLLVPNVITNVQQAFMGPALGMLLKRIGLFLAMIVAGAALWEYATGGQDLRAATRLLGLTLLIYAALGLFKIQFRVSPQLEILWGIIAGLATGAMTIATGVFVIPSGPYLTAIGLERDELVQALGLTFLTGSTSLAIALWLRGGLSAGVAITSLGALVPVMGAMLIGQWARQKLSPESFKKMFYIGLLVLGAFLTVKG